ncbi:hypothetical protein PITCH_A140003 [uncultured Desulfobacterium sp.]|uniref:Uncharacterized protein n=1 Tax=uncultured Desulfobacterium sp. TaxID=201089 RepID=A0A445MSV8_9BACT|nr:hypothetical protein PITCH_A140003 [uncultured Desulfobacterium sp.]
MNRLTLHVVSDVSNVPHVRGDEPEDAMRLEELGICSPRTWG